VEHHADGISPQFATARRSSRGLPLAASSVASLERLRVSWVIFVLRSASDAPARWTGPARMLVLVSGHGKSSWVAVPRATCRGCGQDAKCPA
jgi:hypothetical protein